MSATDLAHDDDDDDDDDVLLPPGWRLPTHD